jgi:hypothetical protein
VASQTILMRAHLVRELLGERRVAVDVVTTSEEGVAFLGALGTPAELLSPHYRMEFDDRQNMDRGGTEARLLSYLGEPERCRKDLATLRARAAGADLVVNDSFHPALLLAPWLAPRSGMRIVHVYGEHLRDAVVAHFKGRAPRAFAEFFGRSIERLLGHGFAQVAHTFDPGAADPLTIALPPILPLPRRAPAAVRADLSLGEGERLAVVYLNDHFRDPAVARAIEEGLAGFRLRAVGEGYAARPRWIARDPRLVDAIAAADLFVSCPGMGALAQARLFEVPFAALVTDQPEQQKNLRFLPSRAVVIPLGELRGLARRLRDAAQALASPATARPDPAGRVHAVHARWTHAFLDLLAAARRPGEAPPPEARCAV